MFETIKNAIRGNKTYITGGIAIATALVAWATDNLSNVQFATAVFVALQTVFIRAAVAKVE